MPVPSVITDLSTTAGSNSPAGTDAIGTTADDYIRAQAAFIAQLRDGSKNLALGSAGAPSCAFTGDSNTGIYSPGADQVSLTASGVEQLRVGAAGVYWANTLSNPAATQPMFSAATSASRTAGVNGAGTLGTYSTTNGNHGGSFDASTGIFTAPVTGVYLFTWVVYLQTATSGPDTAVILYDGSAQLTIAGEVINADSRTYQGGSLIIPVNASTGIRLYATTLSGSGGFTPSAFAASFSGYLLG